MNYIKFDPKVFIRPPYLSCPKCGDEDNYGVLMICERHYVRRCKKCRHDESYQLPELNKKVIYIDQFALSNMMKHLNPNTKAHQKGDLDEYWGQLFSKLDRLCKLQLIICPDSTYHSEESLMSPFYEPLKRMYELLSHGVSFKNGAYLKKHQLYEHAMMWIEGRKEEFNEPDIDTVVHGRINEWQERLIISAEFSVDPNWVDELRTAREQAHQGITDHFERWQKETGKAFGEWFNDESMSFGPCILNEYFKYHIKKQEIFKGLLEPRLENLFPTFGAEVVQTVIDAFKNVGVRDNEIEDKVFEYLNSPVLKEIPFIKISALLLAALARKAAAGQQKPPNQGTLYDFNIISVLLPYCNAMFIDKDCHAYLNEKPLCDDIQQYGTKVFSLNNKNEFVDYLNEIEKNASREHMFKVNEVYGENFFKPYTTMYKDN